MTVRIPKGWRKLKTMNKSPCPRCGTVTDMPFHTCNSEQPSVAMDERLEETVQQIVQRIDDSNSDDVDCIRQAIINYTKELRDEVVELAELNRNAVAGNEHLKHQLDVAKAQLALSNYAHVERLQRQIAALNRKK